MTEDAPLAPLASSTTRYARSTGREGERAGTRVRILVGVSLVVGLALRIWVLHSRMGGLDSDEAIVGIMARHLLHNHEFHTFYLGQNYGGSQEPMMAAALFALFGSSVVALKSVPIALTMVAVWLVWRVGLRTVGRVPAALAAAVFWVAPSAYVWHTTKERGFYEFTIVAGLFCVLMVLRLVERPSRRDAGALGLAAGLAWWATPQMVYLVAPACLYLVARRPRILRLAWAALPAFLIGASPWIKYNIGHGWLSTKIPPVPIHFTYARRLHNFYGIDAPMVLGLRSAYVVDWLIPVLGHAAYAAAVAGFIWAVVRRPKGTELLLIVCIVYPILFAISPFSFYFNEPRYLFFLSPIVALLLARACVSRRHLDIVLVAVAIALSVAGLAAMNDWGRRFPQAYDLVAPDTRPLVHRLDGMGIDRLYGDYWIAYKVSFETRERLLVAPVDNDRYPPFGAAVRARQDSTYALVRSTRERAFEQRLVARGIPYDRAVVTRYAIYRIKDRNLRPEDVADIWPQ